MNKAKGRQGTKHKTKYEHYRSRGTRQTNKVRKLRKHLLRFIADACAKECLKRLVGKSA